MTRVRLVDASTSLPDALRWSLGVRIGEACAPNRGGTNARGARRPSCFETIRFTLYQFVSKPAFHGSKTGRFTIRRDPIASQLPGARRPAQNPLPGVPARIHAPFLDFRSALLSSPP